MGRMTRKKAAEVAEQLHIDEDDLLHLPHEDAAIAAKAKSVTPEPAERLPLGELAPNSADSKSQSDDGAQELKRSTRGRKGGKKTAKGKQNDLAASTASKADGFDENNAGAVLPDEMDSAPSPASEKAAEDLMRDVPGLTIEDTTSAGNPPTSEAVKLTRSQLKRQPEPKSLVDGIGQTPEEQSAMKEETVSFNHSALDAPASPLPTAVPNVVSHLRVDTPAKRSTSNKENIEPETMATPTSSSNYDHLERAVVSAATPPSGSRSPTSGPEDPIVALDELDDAVENINKDIPEVQPSPEKPKTAKPTSPSPRKREKAAPVVRTTKAAAARISMAHNKEAASSQAPALGRPRPSAALGRASSVRESSISKAAPAGKRFTSTSSTKEEKSRDGEGERKEVVIPHSKPRPVSMSFPTPPPPPKSTKAPTQSTFHLPGEAIAAKLKAQREARQQKEIEDAEKRKAFKARPAPSALSKAPSVRGTNASRARESIMNGKELKTSTSLISSALGRANSVATTRPSAARPRNVSREPSKPASSSSSKPGAPSTSARPRPSTALANLSKPRTSMSASTGTRAPSNSTSSKGTVKGKEVFNRAAVAKANAEKEKQDREGAAKKARAEAAERSRQLSREFAEKQKAKKQAAGAKGAAAKSGVAGTIPEQPIAAETSTAVDA